MTKTDVKNIGQLISLHQKRGENILSFYIHQNPEEHGHSQFIKFLKKTMLPT